MPVIAGVERLIVGITDPNCASVKFGLVAWLSDRFTP